MAREPRRWAQLLLGIPASRGATKLEMLLHARSRHLRYTLPTFVLVWLLAAFAHFGTVTLVLLGALSVLELVSFANLSRRIRDERRG